MCEIAAMIKMQTLVFSVVVWLVAAVACCASDAEMGVWTLKGSKSEIALGIGRTTKVIYSTVGDKIKITLEGVDQNAAPTQGVWVGKFDGQVYPVKGNFPYDGLKYEAVNDRVQNVTAMKGGKVLWTGRVTISRNGKSRVVTMVGRDENGKKRKSKAVYERR